MIASIIARIGAWWASKHASYILLAVVIGLAGIHYASLRASAAKCKAAAEFQQALKRLSAQIVEQTNDERDQANEQIDQADNPCLDADVADLLQDAGQG